jgi:putative membrane protein
MCSIMFVVALITFIVLVLLIARGVYSGRIGMQTTSSTARQILDERYAKGEIDRQQYEQMKKDIR